MLRGGSWRSVYKFRVSGDNAATLMNLCLLLIWESCECT